MGQVFGIVRDDHLVDNIAMSVIDKYLESVTVSQRAALERIRKITREIAPTAEEAMTYGVPGFKYKGKFFLGFSVNKNHLSLYPASGAIEALKEELGSYDLSKGTIRFSEVNPIPEPILKQIIKYRLREVADVK
jgi:uncharacterized protein YdhG (YjbR/CyaY superfamily)